MNVKFEKRKKYLVIALFLIATIFSLIFMGKVSINYNLSDYLDDSTETKISLNIIEEEFGATGDIQVMIENISTQKAKDVRDTIKDIPNVLNVNFDEYDESYYKNGNALFIVIVDGDEYSDVATTVFNDIQTALDEQFSVNYGGAVIEKANLRENIENEIVYILVVAICLVIAIMLLMSKSWLEPIILLLASGVSILINMGTNAIFGEISYITNAVAAILQLALSIDYSIVLLHNYRAVKEIETNNEKAMLQAIKGVVKPVSASALTTIAGLLALLFMSFKIGFDIGIVLIKGIVISGITSLTLLPALLLLLEKPMTKTKKNELVLKGKGYCNLAFKWSKAIVPIALVIIIICGVLQTGNSYSFSDTKLNNNSIQNTFGQNNTVVVVYEKGNNDFENEQALITKLSTYKKSDGTPVLKNHTAYTNTVRELYDVEKAARKLDIPQSDVELLLTMYHLYNDNSLVKLNTLDFVKYADYLIKNDTDAQSFIDNETVKTIRTMLIVDEIMNNEHTAQQFHTLATTGVMEGTDLDLFSVKQMYGLYFYNSIIDKTADFETILDYMIAASKKEETADMFDTKTVEDLTALSQGIKQFNAQMDMPLTKTDFQGYMYQKYGATIDYTTATQIYTGYYYSIGQTTQETIPFLNLISFLVSQNQIIEPTAVATIQSYATLYETINNNYSYEQFLPVLSQVATALTGETPTITTTALAVQQIYIMYFYENNAIPVAPILGRTFVDFVNTTYPQNAIVGGQLTQDGKLKLADIRLVDTFLTDENVYNFKDITSKLQTLQNEIQSLSETVALGNDKVSGVYIKYAVENELNLTNSVMAFEILDFVAGNMDENELLKTKMSNDNREKVTEAQNDIQKAKDLFVGENYSRMLLSVDLPNESEESTAFVKYLSAEVKQVFGENAHIAGEIVSTNDLSETFDKDNLFISIFTIISIFVVVMIIFKSLSLPILLVAIIQGAIWIAMSTSLLTGPMFFMSYIVTTCILMGATIDYGILMSTNYVQYRATLDKKEALYKSVEVAMPTVFTSGLILTVCGFVIGIIATQNAISTVGILLGKGTLISVLMITIVLPSVLYMCDKFILKFSLKDTQSKK